MCNNCNIAYTISIFYTLLINTCNQYNRFFVCDLNIVKKLTTKLDPPEHVHMVVPLIIYQLFNDFI